MSAPTRLAVIVNNRPMLNPARKGVVCVLTELQQLELVAWYKTRCELGTWTSKAAELGVPAATLKGIVDRRLGLR